MTQSFEAVLDVIQFSLTLCSFLAVLGVIVFGAKPAKGQPEADEDLRDRAQGLWQTAARGTEKALIQGAREAGAYTAGVTRVQYD